MVNGLALPKVSVPTAPNIKQLGSGKLAFRTKPAALIGPNTGKRGAVIAPINQMPEYHRKVASDNVYLEYILRHYSE